MNDLKSISKSDTKFLQHTCPWWFLFAFDNPLRKLYQDPGIFLAPLISPGDRILDVGCGMGFLTLPAAVLVGEKGEVVAADLQQRMLDGLWRKALKANLGDRIQRQLASQDSLGVSGSFDTALAFWMVHEVHDRLSFLAQIRDLLKPGGKLLIAEPYLHVSRKDFLRTERIAGDVGLTLIKAPEIGFSRSLLAVKEDEDGNYR